MVVLDVNILVAAYRTDHPDHEAVTPWFDSLLGGGSPFGVPDAVWVGFVRIVTNRRIFLIPADVSEAFEFVTAVAAHPGYRSMTPDEDLIPTWQRLCREGQAGGDLVPDAYIAAVAMRIGGTVATRDRDFRRFDGLRTLDPAVT